MDAARERHNLKEGEQAWQLRRSGEELDALVVARRPLEQLGLALRSERHRGGMISLAVDESTRSGGAQPVRRHGGQGSRGREHVQAAHSLQPPAGLACVSRCRTARTMTSRCSPSSSVPATYTPSCRTGRQAGSACVCGWVGSCGEEGSSRGGGIACGTALPALPRSTATHRESKQASTLPNTTPPPTCISSTVTTLSSKPCARAQAWMAAAHSGTVRQSTSAARCALSNHSALPLLTRSSMRTTLKSRVSRPA